MMFSLQDPVAKVEGLFGVTSNTKTMTEDDSSTFFPSLTLFSGQMTARLFQ